MAFKFEIKNTEVFNAVKREKFLLFRFASFFKNIFLILFLISFLLAGFSFGYSALKMMILFLTLYVIFWEIDLFKRLKIVKPTVQNSITDASINLENYNLAQFLNFDVTNIVLDSINFCKKKKIQVNSTALFFSAIKLNKDINLICFRLGLNPKKLLTNIKNYLEKIEKHGASLAGNSFSEDFIKIIEKAIKISVDEKRTDVGENQILVALANENEFFKTTLIESDLKAEDVENLTLWLQSAENSLENNKKFWTLENLLRKGSL